MPKPIDPESRWMTLSSDDKLISEGKTPNEAINLAKEITEDFIVTFIPENGISYIF